MKKTPLKRKSKSDTKKIQDKLWQECRRIQIIRYITQSGSWKCFTCNKDISGSNRQLGHFIPNSVGGALLRFNLDNLRLQCYYCNINLGGNGSEFYKRLVETEGQDFVDNLFKLKHQTVKASGHYIKLLAEYERQT